jgi:hypothetical protein
MEKRPKAIRTAQPERNFRPRRENLSPELVNVQDTAINTRAVQTSQLPGGHLGTNSGGITLRAAMTMMMIYFGASTPLR